MGYVVLDRTTDVPHPDYCLHGHTWCVICRNKVHLGRNTHGAVITGHRPLCRPCANKYIPSDAPALNLNDHLRKDGPHD